MFRAPESKGGRVGSRCGAGSATVTWGARGRWGGRGELTEPESPRPGRGGGRARGTRRPECASPRVRSQYVPLHWRARWRCWPSRLLRGGGRGGAAGILGPCGVCASGWASGQSPVSGALSTAADREPGGALPHFTDKETGGTASDRRRVSTGFKHSGTHSSALAFFLACRAMGIGSHIESPELAVSCRWRSQLALSSWFFSCLRVFFIVSLFCDPAPQ